jgi:hypothetical protein
MTTRLSDERLGELLGLIEDADSVELKLTVPHSDHGTVAGALGLDPLDAEIRQVYFFDTPRSEPLKGGSGGACAPGPRQGRRLGRGKSMRCRADLSARRR